VAGEDWNRVLERRRLDNRRRGPLTCRRPTLHALRRLWEVEPFHRIVAPAPTNGYRGFTEKELAWLLTNAPAETLVLKPMPPGA
jgi:hypothetical protein